MQPSHQCKYVELRECLQEAIDAFWMPWEGLTNIEVFKAEFRAKYPDHPVIRWEWVVAGATAS